MASIVGICNLALARLGDEATVISINPPEGSAQAGHCQRFYPMALDSLLESHAWGFATKRATLAPWVSAAPAEWGYAYAVPGDMLRALSVVSVDAVSGSVPYVDLYDLPVHTLAAPNEFALEIAANGQKVLYANLDDAILIYISRVTDAAQFSPLFVDALAWVLASHLAGVVLKGDSGIKMSLSCMQYAQAIIGQAKTSDSNQRVTRQAHNVPWMMAR